MSLDLPKQYDHSQAQKRWYEFWETSGCFDSDPDPERDPFTMVIPPPNVTGALHLGHALNNTLQDVLIRYKRMQGFNALWIPGTDHAGIATQAVVERRLKELEGKTRHDLGREQLVERIWSWKDQYEQRIRGQLKQMGCSCDWRRTRFTLDDICARAVRATFYRMFHDGLIYRGKRLVNWDTFLQTAVSDDEVFNESVKGHFWRFRYPVIDPKPGEPEFVEIATTRPETMLGDTAVAVHPDPAAALDAAEAKLREEMERAPEKERAEKQERIDEIRERRTTMLPLLETLSQMARDGRKLKLPLMGREIPLVADRWAKPELGSGCVKITPAHDPNDYEVGKRCDLPMVNILNGDGTLNHNAKDYAGLTIPKARRRVVEDLEALELMVGVEDRKIELPHSDRSKTPIEPLLTDQWFVQMESLAQLAIDAVDDGRVEIIPARYAKTYRDWLGEKRDWPVSRQLWWGHQIPVWSLNVKDQIDMDLVFQQVENLIASRDGWGEISSIQTEINEERAAAERRGGDAAKIAREKLPYGTLHVCLAEDAAELVSKLEEIGLVRDPDVLDTWFSSGLWPHSTLGWPEQTTELNYYYPTSVLSTSRDIITLWVARMVLMGLYNVDAVPFHQVFIHPKILDGEGETMSKSKGNGVDPKDVIEKSGADSLRFALVYITTETQDARLPVEYVCPHCEQSIQQTKQNRQLKRMDCPHCGKPFSTQWAESAEDMALPRASVTAERFEVARNFCNKLWNASRFTIMNLEGYEPVPIDPASLRLEDKWLLSRLDTVTDQVTAALDEFRFADVGRILYEFAWDDFCSFFVEMVKYRLQDETLRPVAQGVLAAALDRLLRLLHPIMPFLTEEVWHLLGQVAPYRGVTMLEKPSESIMKSDWPVSEGFSDPAIESHFAVFEGVLRGVRDIRMRQNVPPRETMPLSIRCEPAGVSVLEPFRPYFLSMANAEVLAWGPDVTAPPAAGSFRHSGDVSGIGPLVFEGFVDLAAFIDFDKEIARLEKEHANLVKQIDGKEKKLGNEAFVSKAPADVVEAERRRLTELREQVAAILGQLTELRAQQSKA